MVCHAILGPTLGLMSQLELVEDQAKAAGLAEVGLDAGSIQEQEARWVREPSSASCLNLIPGITDGGRICHCIQTRDLLRLNPCVRSNLCDLVPCL